MTFSSVLRDKPWIPFLVMALVMQQANMLTYKFGGEQAVPQAFLVYSFFFQTVFNAALIFVSRSRGFSVKLPDKMKPWTIVVGVLYAVNELAFISAYRAGGPYAFMMVVFCCASLTILTLFAFIVLKEQVHLRKAVGLLMAFASIYLIKMG